MTKTLEATFDGAVFRPDEPVELQPNTRVQIVVTVKSTSEQKPKLEDIIQELRDDVEDDFESPTQYAEDRAVELLQSAKIELSRSMPEPTIAPDGEGGLILVWKNDSRHIRLFCPANNAKLFYLYFEDSDVFDTIPNPKPIALIEKLKWLTKQSNQ
jgi:predicted DNA-binding antitoxin AbrB/MazE fold protein